MYQLLQLIAQGAQLWCYIAYHRVTGMIHIFPKIDGCLEPSQTLL